jgi:putative multiple sugar transport system ATP-binding protein
MKRVGLKENPSVLIKDIGTGKQQLVEIAKALSKNVKLLILDEPTSSLNEEDSKMLLDMLLGFKEEGLTSIIITHKLNEVSYCADRITVLRDGSTIETIDNANHDIDEDRIIKGMVGRELTDRYPTREHNVGNEVLFEAKNWTVYHPVYTEKCMDKNVNFKVHKGEIVGFSGLQGAGRTELAMSLFGKSYGSSISGQEYINGQEVHLKNEQDAIAHGLAYVTEDRKTNGLVLSDTIARNTTMAKMNKIANKGIIDFVKEKKVAQEYVKAMKTKTPSVDQAVGNLSGGNQQKVLLSKWMFAEPDVLILDEPTRGIDVGAKYEIYCIMNDMVKQGKAVVMISSELPELLGMCDRIYVMNEGEVVGEFMAEEATQEKIMSAILSHNSSDL